MAWSYSDWDSTSYTGTARLTRLTLHIQEVRAQLGPDLSSSGKSVNYGGLLQYLERLERKRESLESATNTNAVGWTRGRVK